MFESRVRVLLIGFALCLLVLAGRLTQLQVVQGSYYSAAAERALIMKSTSLPFVRGSIRDRRGQLLVSEEPCWEVRLDYAVMAADVEASRGDGSVADTRKAGSPAMARQVKRLRRAQRYPEARTDGQVEASFRDELERMWRDLARLSAIASPLSVEELREKAQLLYARIARIRKQVQQRRGFESQIAEELETQVILTRLSGDEAITARESLADYPWVHVEPASTRAFAENLTPLAHVLGRVGRVEAEDIAGDPAADDPFVRYMPDEPIGTSGVEAAAERSLRGRRGEITTDRLGSVIEEIAAQDGLDVRLTIDTELQWSLYRLLERAVRRTPDSSGGSIVVLDVPSREVLALVSYPSYDPARFDELYSELRADTEHLPLVFRAVANHYAPGSIVKPLVCLAGLTNGKIGLDTRETCTGYLFQEQRDAWRCWEMHGTNQRMAHGAIDVVEALTGSCNIFMYRVGERLGVDRITEAFDMFGIGKPTGIGLREEVQGINPTRAWFAERDRGRKQSTAITGGTLRNFAIGQGEVTVTPLQAANVMATYASGRFRPISLIRGGDPTPEWALPGAAAQWGAIRAGIFGVVNDPDGTAYKYAHFEHPEYVLCGKTGSATTPPWPTAFRVPFVSRSGVRQEVEVPARTRQDAIGEVAAEHPGAVIDAASVDVSRRWPRNPPADDEHAHAWFAGYLQAADAEGRPRWSVSPRIAFAVLIEFGGSGGRTSGPLAKDVAQTVLDLFGPELAIDDAGSMQVVP